MNRHIARSLAVSAAAALTLSLAACGGGNQEDAADGGIAGEVVTDGSSTVQPLTAAAGELFAENNPQVNVSVATSGTGGGFEKFCAGETDISNASREIKEDEAKEAPACESNGIKYTALHVATDALTVVVSKDNDFIKCLTVDELKKLWEPAAEKKVTTWNQVNPKFPNEKIELYGPGTDSGTFDYFTKEISGEEGASRSDYNASEDDNVLVKGVEGSKSALGYFGYTYFEENSDKLKAVEIDGGEGCVAPNVETAQSGKYAPLSRPLFIYVNNDSYAKKKQVAAFIDYYVDSNKEIVDAAKFIPLSEEQSAELADEFAKLKG